MASWDIYFDTDLSITQQLEILKPVLRSWIGNDFMQYYRPDIDYYSFQAEDSDFLLILSRNSSYQKSDYDNDRFRYNLGCVDTDNKHTFEESIEMVQTVLELLWSYKIPTCTPGLEEELPYAGGEEGPFPWPD